MHANTLRAINKLARANFATVDMWADDTVVELKSDHDTITVYQVDGGRWLWAWEENGQFRSNDLPASMRDYTYRYTVASYPDHLASAGIRTYRSATDALRAAMIGSGW